MNGLMPVDVDFVGIERRKFTTEVIKVNQLKIKFHPRLHRESDNVMEMK